MTHRECMAVLLDAGRGAAARQEAEAHVACCSDCWAVLRLLHELAMGAPPEGADRMAELFGCERVQDRLYLLPGLSAAAPRPASSRTAMHSR